MMDGEFLYKDEYGDDHDHGPMEWPEESIEEYGILPDPPKDAKPLPVGDMKEFVMPIVGPAYPKGLLDEIVESQPMGSNPCAEVPLPERQTGIPVGYDDTTRIRCRYCDKMATVCRKVTYNKHGNLVNEYTCDEHEHGRPLEKIDMVGASFDKLGEAATGAAEAVEELKEALPVEVPLTPEEEIEARRIEDIIESHLDAEYDGADKSISWYPGEHVSTRIHRWLVERFTGWDIEYDEVVFDQLFVFTPK